jgi:hypothetical protein
MPTGEINTFHKVLDRRLHDKPFQLRTYSVSSAKRILDVVFVHRKENQLSPYANRAKKFCCDNVAA